MGKKKMQMELPSEPPKELQAYPFYGMKLDDEQLTFANAIWNPEVDIIFCNSKAGTGKTTIAAGVANMLVQYGMFNNILYIMSPYGERRQGWLPGTIEEKSSVYFEPFRQALVKCGVNLNTNINNESMENQKNGTGYITCVTDTYIRGDTFENQIVIIDEAQNFTFPQLKKTLTRIGNHAKVIVIGHDRQCDLENPATSGFGKYVKHFEDMERCQVVTLVNNHRSWISQHADALEE